MIPRLKPDIGAREIFAAFRPKGAHDVVDFERGFASLMGQKYAVGFPYGRTALFCLLKALGINNREIICPAYTCVVVPHAIVVSGNEPIFVDSHEFDFNMDLDLAQSKITEKTAAIIATSIFGYPVNLDKLSEIKQKFPHIRVIQDCAHSFRARWHGRSVNIEGDAALFGLNISKTITSIFGGMITTDCNELYNSLLDYRHKLLHQNTRAKQWNRKMYLICSTLSLIPAVYGLTHKFEKKGLLKRFTCYYDEINIDMPQDWLTALSDTEARVGLVQLEKYNNIIASRSCTAKVYNQELQEMQIPAFKLPPIVDGATYSHYSVIASNRERYIEKAAKKGIQLGRLIEYCIPDMPSYRDRLANKEIFPIAKKLSCATLNFPIWKGVNRKKVIESIR